MSNNRFTQSHLVIVVALLLFALMSVVPCFAEPECNIPNSTQLRDLSLYVQQKYQLPFPVTIEPHNISSLKGSCFLLLRFTAAGTGPQNFGLRLYLSPDGRFLAKDLFDTNLNPIEADNLAKSATLAGLTRGKAPTLGPADAYVTITVFSDSQCPFCKQQAAILEKEVIPSEPRVRLVFRNLPLSIHDWSLKASLAAACAGVQSANAFWSAHDFLFQNQRRLNESSVVEELRQYLLSHSNIDDKKFDLCISNHQASNLIEADLKLAQEQEIESTPTVFVNAIRINGVATSEQLRTLIHQLTAQAESNGSANK